MEAIRDRGGRWRRWAPYGLLVVAPVAAILVQALAPAPHGHWSSHLGSAAMSAAQLVVLVAAAVALAIRRPPAGRLATLVLAALLVVVAAGLVMQAVGNQRVAASMWRTDYGDEAAGLVGPAYPGFESGHDLAARGDLLVWLGGLAFTLVLGALRRVPLRVVVAGVFLSLLPPWMLPGTGVVFVLAWLLAEAYFRPRARASSSRPILERPGRFRRFASS